MSNPNKIDAPQLFAGFATLMSVSFLDNIRGPLLPVLRDELGINNAATGYFLTIGSFSAIAATLMLGRLLRFYQEKKVCVLVCLFCAIPGGIAPFVSSVSQLMLLGLVMGSSVALMGSTCNIHAINGSPAHLRGKLLSIQQVMYGIGSFLAPFGFAYLYGAAWPWWTAIVIIALVNCGLAVVLQISLSPSPVIAPEASKQKLSLKLALPVVLFAIFVGGEVLTSMWMSTYLIQVANLEAPTAARLNSYFFLVIGITRVAIFLFLPERWERTVIIIALAVGIGFILLSLSGFYQLLPLAGLVGPFFPLFMTQVSKVFPTSWKNMTIWIFASIQFMLGCIHLSVGNLADIIGIGSAYYLGPSLIFIALILVIIFFRVYPLPSQRSA